MKYAIWGTAATASRFAHYLRGKFDFFIDSDRKKSGEYLGKKIWHPDQIVDWHDLFVYVPYNFYVEISTILKKKGLKENFNFVRYDNVYRLTKPENEANVEDTKNKLMLRQKEWQRAVVYIGQPYSLNLKAVTNKIFQIKHENFKMLSYTFWKSTKEIESDFGIETIMAPIMLNGFTKIENEEYSYAEIGVIEKNFRCIDMSAHKFTYITRCIVDFWSFFVEIVNPKMIICGGGISCPHRILACICRLYKIPIITFHLGCIPGTYSFDTWGEMGRSLPSVEYERFRSLAYVDKDMSKAEKIWLYLYKNRINRKIQPHNNFLLDIKPLLHKDRPILFFAGQNDVESFMIPYNDTVKTYNSPIFESSLSAAIYLADLCAKRQWNFVYKPHPMYMELEQRKKLPENVIFIESADINELIDFADVTVTILSAVAYNALVRYKPVVMLGYTQLRGKGCTYEAFVEENIESNIDLALRDGFTDKQQEMFKIHIAQCLKYYLYDDLQERSIRYGKVIPDTLEGFYDINRIMGVECERRDL